VPCDTKMTLGFSFGWASVCLWRIRAHASGRYVQLQPSEWMYASIASSSFCLAWPVGTVSSRAPLLVAELTRRTQPLMGSIGNWARRS
jgi:hypothetical protein